MLAAFCLACAAYACHGHNILWNQDWQFQQESKEETSEIHHHNHNLARLLLSTFRPLPVVVSSESPSVPKRGCRAPHAVAAVTALGNKILVNIETAPQKRKSGILMPNAYVHQQTKDELDIPIGMQKGVVEGIGAALESGFAVGQHVVIKRDPKGHKVLVGETVEDLCKTLLFSPDDIVAVSTPGGLETRFNNYLFPGPLEIRGSGLFVKENEAEERSTVGGLILSEEGADASMRRYTVAAVGPGTTHPVTGEFLATTCKEGDVVLLSSPGFEKGEYKDEKVFITDTDAIIGILSGDTVSVDALTMTGDKLLVKTGEVGEGKTKETARGIVLVEESEGEEEDRPDPKQGEILKVGPYSRAMNVGDSVLFKRDTGSPFMMMDGNNKLIKCMVVSESNCLAKW